MNISYILNTISTIPYLPLLYFQGAQIRKKVPKLPEAKLPYGYVDIESDKSLSIVTIGESTIAGVGVATHQEGFTGSLAQEIAETSDVNVDWKVYAKSGYTAKQVVQKILPKIDDKNVDLFVIGLGGNDAFTFNSPYFWRKNIQKLISQIRSKHQETPIVFVNMPPIREFPAFTKLIKKVLGTLVETLGQELRKQIQGQKNVYYNSEVITIDSWTQKFDIANNPEAFFSDGVHPSRFTYQVWAKDTADFIFNKSIIEKA